MSYRRHREKKTPMITVQSVATATVTNILKDANVISKRL